jgi:hypothetical protein
MNELENETPDHRSTSQPSGGEQFHRDVFPAELEEINKRRRQLEFPDNPPDSAASAKLGLCGLALSGGGIRSATFSLGVIQALAKHNLLASVDYMSTVSGGGFIGSCISSLLNDKDMGPQQDRFPLHYEAGTKEPLAVGQLRQGARYLAPGRAFDKLRILALILRGVLSSLLLFVFIILLLAFVTEFFYEVGNRLQIRFDYLALVGITVFVALVIASPLISRLRLGRSTWVGRNFEELIFTLALVFLLSIMAIVPTMILTDQWLNTPWSDVSNSITANLLRPFEPRDYVQWFFVLALLVMFMFVGRASKNAARWGGQLLLFSLGMLGPLFLFLIYTGLLAMTVDSPYITVRELLRLDATYASQLDDMDRVNPDLRRKFRSNSMPLDRNAQVVTLEANSRWLVHDGERGFGLVRVPGGVSVRADYQYALDRGRIPPELRATLAQKGYRLSTQVSAFPERIHNRYKVTGSHAYWIAHDTATGGWSLEQVVAGTNLTETLQRVSYSIPMSEVQTGMLIHEGVSLSEDDLAQAIRFAGQGEGADVVLLIDNSVLPFNDQEGFSRALKEGLTQVLESLDPTVRMVVFWFDERVHAPGALEPLTTEAKQALLQRLFGDETPGLARLDFKGQHSNIRAGFARAMRELSENGRESARKSIILISDGIAEGTANRQGADLRTWIENDIGPDAQTAGVRLSGIALSEGADFDLFSTLARKTGGDYIPFFESGRGINVQDFIGALERLKATVGRERLTPVNQVRITDQLRDTRYILTLDKNGVRIRALLSNHDLTPADLANRSGRWRDVFEENGVQLGSETTIKQVSDGRWEVLDPYQYTISRSGRRLKIRRGEEDWGEGFEGLLAGGIPQSLWDGRTDWVLLTAFAILFMYWLSVNINQMAAHNFYRDKLSRAYIFRVTRSGAVEHHDKQLLSGLNSEGSTAPYHLINAALNLQGSKDPSLRGRTCDFFIFSKRFIGSMRTGFLKTKVMESYDDHLDLATAMAISGAAAAPNAGVATKRPLIFILTLLNVRLGYWLPNPLVAKDASWFTRLGLRRGPGPKYVLKESVGHLNANGSYINVSDGGHIENLAVFELLRRRCKFIIAVDGERDSDMDFGGLVKLLLYARIDLGVEIDIDLDAVRENEHGLSESHWAIGTIHYEDGETGCLIYIKSSMTGDEYENIRKYRTENPRFPHEPTGDQFFTEAQFEAYRSLGYHIGNEVFSNEEVLGKVDASLRQCLTGKT